MIITIIYIFYKKFLTIRISYPVNKFKVTCQMEKKQVDDVHFDTVDIHQQTFFFKSLLCI